MINILKTSVGQTAAKWWADFLREQPTHDNGDSTQSAFSTMLSRKLPSLESDKIDKFEEILTKLIDGRWNGGQWSTLSVDYHPDAILEAAGKEAGLGDLFMRLPFKTIMWLEPQDNKVYVAVGYGGRRKELEI
jgi:hypothetical protein